MQINGEGIENLFMNMVLKTKIKQIQKGTFLCLFTWEWVEHIPIWKVSFMFFMTSSNTNINQFINNIP